MNNNKWLETQWVSFCFDGFPRGILFYMGNKSPQRFLAYNAEHYIQLIWKYLLTHSIAVNVYPQRFIDSYSTLCNKIFLDLDSKDISISFKEMIYLVDFLNSKYGCTPRLVFSGRKGFHIYIDFPAVMLSNYRETVTEFADKYLPHLGTLDKPTLRDKNRCSRLPYTIHQSSNKICMPIDSTMDLETILHIVEPVHKQIYINPNIQISQILTEIDEHITENKEKEDTNGNVSPSHNGIRPCIIVAQKLPLNDSLGAMMRLAIACEYLFAHHRPEEIAPIFVNQDDYNYTKSLMYVTYAQNRDYVPFSCKTIRSLGYCVGCKG